MTCLGQRGGTLLGTGGSVRYDGGQKINRDGVRIWVETYYCSVCGRRLDVKEEVLD